MAEEKEEKEEVEEEAPTPAEAEKTDGEHMIPKSRFDEVNNQLREIQKQLKKEQKEKATAVEKQLEEQGKYKELYEDRGTQLAEAQQKAERVDSLDETVKALLKAQIDSLPELAQKLVPSEMSDQQQLNWIAEKRSLLSKPSAPDIGAHTLGGENGSTAELTADEKEAAKKMGVSEKDYVKQK